MKIKIISAVLVLLIFASTFPAFAESEIKINTAEDLCALAERFSLDKDSEGVTVRLCEDIDISGVSFMPIPIFCGSFKGDNHKITGLSINKGSKTGLFRIIDEGATVDSLCVEGSVVPGGKAEMLGGIAGENYGIISNSSFSGNVKGKQTAGGIAAVNYGKIVNCSFSGFVYAEHTSGGIAGKNHGSILDCKNNGEINIEETVPDYDIFSINFSKINDLQNLPVCTDIGGVCGYSDGIILNCENRGTVGYTDLAYNVGGITGRQSEGYISSCRNYGKVRGHKDVGGIAGHLEPVLDLKFKEDTIKKINAELLSLTEILNSTLDDSDKISVDVQKCLDTLRTDAGKARDAAQKVSDKLEILGDDTTKKANTLSERVSWLTGKTVPIVDEMLAFCDNLTRSCEKLAPAFDNMTHGLEKAETGLINAEMAIRHLDTAVKGIYASANDLSALIAVLKTQIGDVSQIPLVISSINKSVSGLSTSMASAAGALNELAKALAGGSLEAAVPAIASLSSALGSASSAIATIAGGLNALDFSPALIAALPKIKEALSKMHNVPDELADVRKYFDKSTDKLASSAESLAKGTKQLSAGMSFLTEGAKNLQKSVSLLSDTVKEYREFEKIELLIPGVILGEDADEMWSGLELVLLDSGELDTVLDSTSDTLSSDFHKIVNKLKTITELLSELHENSLSEKDFFEDDSNSPDSLNRLDSCIDSCKNEGKICSTENGGGIAGNMSIEIDIDIDDRLNRVDSKSLDFVCRAFSVIRKCENTADVEVKRENGGGIVGNMDVGAVFFCVSSGKIGSEECEKVGGIAGYSTSVTNDDFSKGVIVGKSYLGGIAGLGNTVKNCASLAEITGDDDYRGAIAGDIAEDGIAENNVFVSTGTAGIDGISRKGIAEPVDYSTLSGRENLPEEMNHFTLRFFDEENLLKSVDFDYGASFDSDVFPALPQKEGCYSRWSDAELKSLKNDTDVFAEYIPFITAVKSKDIREDGRVVFLTKGNYTDETVFDTTEIELEENKIPKSFFKRLTVNEAWRISFPDGENELRFLPPDSDDVVFVKDNGAWIKAESADFGSYKVIKTQGKELYLASVSEKIPVSAIVLLIILAAVCTFIAVYFIKRKK